LAGCPACCERWKLTDTSRRNKEQDFKNNQILKSDTPDSAFGCDRQNRRPSPEPLRQLDPASNGHGTILVHGTFWIF
jgi:hypothetical protein